MNSYEELMQQARKLMEQAENARKAELAGVIADIKAKMKVYGITPVDLGSTPPKAKAFGKTKIANFRGPNGELWGGGRGRKPEWVRDVLAAGGDIEQYRI